jgi:hypothetical protein
MTRILNPNVTPTYVAQVSQKDLDDALEVLQVRGASGMQTDRVFGAMLIAIVKHLTMEGSFLVPDDESPKKKRSTK